MAEPTRAAGRVVTGNVAGLLIARAVAAGAGILSLPVVYAGLGPHDFGIWALLTGVIAIASMADLGLAAAGVREVASARLDPAGQRVGAALGIVLAWGVTLVGLATVVTMGAWPALARTLHMGQSAVEGQRAALGLLLAMLFDGLAVPWRCVLEGTQRYTVLSWATGTTALLAAGLAAVVVLLGGGLAALGLTVAVTAGARTALVVAAARRLVPTMTPRLRAIGRADLRRVGGYGARVQVTSASGAVNLELDRFVLSGFFGPATAGGFEIGGRMVNLLRLPPAYVLMALFPMAVARHAEHGQAWLDRFHTTATRYLAAFAGLGAAVAVVCAEPLVRLWLGQATPWAAVNIAVLAPAYAVNLATGATGIVTRVEGRPGRETGYALLSVVLNLALTWPLLRLLGPTGVTTATAIGTLLSSVYFITAYHRSTGRPVAATARAVRSPLLACLAGAGVGAVVAPHLADGPGRVGAALAVSGRASVVLAVGVAVLALTGFLEAGERDRVRGWARRGAARVGLAVGGAS